MLHLDELTSARVSAAQSSNLLVGAEKKEVDDFVKSALQVNDFRLIISFSLHS